MWLYVNQYILNMWSIWKYVLLQSCSNLRCWSAWSNSAQVHCQHSENSEVKTGKVVTDDAGVILQNNANPFPCPPILPLVDQLDHIHVECRIFWQRIPLKRHKNTSLVKTASELCLPHLYSSKLNPCENSLFSGLELSYWQCPRWARWIWTESNKDLRLWIHHLAFAFVRSLHRNLLHFSCNRNYQSI